MDYERDLIKLITTVQHGKYNYNYNTNHAIIQIETYVDYKTKNSFAKLYILDKNYKLIKNEKQLIIQNMIVNLPFYIEFHENILLKNCILNQDTFSTMQKLKQKVLLQNCEIIK